MASFSEHVKVAQGGLTCLGSGGLAVRSMVAVSGFKVCRDGGIVTAGVACAQQTGVAVFVTGPAIRIAELRV